MPLYDNYTFTVVPHYDDADKPNHVAALATYGSSITGITLDHINRALRDGKITKPGKYNVVTCRDGVPTEVYGPVTVGVTGLGIVSPKGF